MNLGSCQRVALQAEVTGKSYSGATFHQTSTADLVVGPVFWIRPGIFIRPAWSYAFAYDAAQTSFAKKSGRQISIGYHPGTPCCEVYAPPPPPPPAPNRPPTVPRDRGGSRWRPAHVLVVHERGQGGGQWRRRDLRQRLRPL